MIARAKKEIDFTDGFRDGLLMHRHVPSAVYLEVLKQFCACFPDGLKREDSSRAAHEAAREQREVPYVGANIDEHITRPEQGLDHVLGSELVFPSDVDVLAKPIVQPDL